ncbi:hypothetical protein ALC60_10674, partial [Trachymyrmex zeteki]
ARKRNIKRKYTISRRARSFPAVASCTRGYSRQSRYEGAFAYVYPRSDVETTVAIRPVEHNSVGTPFLFFSSLNLRLSMESFFFTWRPFNPSRSPSRFPSLSLSHTIDGPRRTKRNFRFLSLRFFPSFLSSAPRLSPFLSLPTLCPPLASLSPCSRYSRVKHGREGDETTTVTTTTTVDDATRCTTTSHATNTTTFLYARRHTIATSYHHHHPDVVDVVNDADDDTDDVDETARRDTQVLQCITVLHSARVHSLCA